MSSASDDVPLWQYSTTGQYTVKSGYYIAQANSDQTQALPTSSQAVAKKLWQIRIPQKLKFFLWRMLHHALPVSTQLQRRGIKIATLCQLCGEEDETINHLFFNCRVSSEIWSLAPLQGYIASTLTDDICINLDHILSLKYNLPDADIQNHHSQFLLGPYLLWRIWKGRNQLLFQSQRCGIPDLINNAIFDMLDFAKAEASDAEATRHPSHHTPTHGQLTSTLQLYTDASWVSNSEQIGIGWTLLQHGNILMTAKSSLPPVSTPFEAEATALYEALLHLNRLHYTDIMVFGDCKSLLTALQQDLNYNGQNGASIIWNATNTLLLRDISKLSKMVQVISFTFLPRECNTFSDHLAVQARITNSPFCVKLYNYAS